MQDNQTTPNPEKIIKGDAPKKISNLLVSIRPVRSVRRKKNVKVPVWATTIKK